MQTSIKFSLYEMILYLILGGVISYLYYATLFQTLKMMKKFQKKGLFLFLSTLCRLTIFILLSLILTQCRVEKFIWYILGFMLVRLFAIHHIKKGVING